MTASFTKPSAYDVDYDATTGDTIKTAVEKNENAIDYLFTNIEDATTTSKGLSRLATLAETITGTSTTLATTPAGVAAKVADSSAEKLTGDRDYYVRTDGSDSNDGLTNTSGGAFLTIQHAVDVATALNLSGYKITINVADGAYTAGAQISGAITGAKLASDFDIVGNQTTPGDCTITTSDGSHCFEARLGAAIRVLGFKLSTTSGDADCLYANHGGEITFGDIEFGECAHSHREAKDGGRIYSSSDGAYTISGSAVSHIHCTTGSRQLVGGPRTITLSGTPDFSSYFCGVAFAYVEFNSSIVFSGSATGVRFFVHNTGAIKTGSTFLDMLDYLPGDTDGEFYGCGTYNDWLNIVEAYGDEAPLVLERTGTVNAMQVSMKKERRTGAAGHFLYDSFYPAGTDDTLVEGGRHTCLTLDATPGAVDTAMLFGVRCAGTYTNMLYISAGNIRPSSDGQWSLGAASYRVGQIYSTVATISTSDAREKTAVSPLQDAEIKAAIALAKEIGTYQFLAAVEEKGDAARLHVGLTVQRAVEVMESFGLDPLRYGFICYDKWDAEEEILEADGSVSIPGREAGDRWSFRMDQLNAFMVRGIVSTLGKLAD